MLKLEHDASSCACERFKNILRRQFVNLLQYRYGFGSFLSKSGMSKRLILLERDCDRSLTLEQ